MTKLIHISYDLRPKKNLPVTTAVKDIITETQKFADVNIIDLVRVRRFKEEMTKAENNKHLMINSFGLPYSIFFIYSLNRAYKKIIDAADKNLFDMNSVDIIHAHKVTFEGYLAYHLSVKYKTKLILTLRATDTWVFKKRPDLVPYFKLVFEKSDRIIYLVPYIIKLLKKRLGDSFFEKHIKNKLVFIPNIIDREINYEESISVKDHFLSAMWMEKRIVERKNLKGLLKAVKMLNRPDFKLKLIGDGNYLPTVKKWVNQLGIENNIIFQGYIPNREMDKHYAEASGFLLPSLGESFGMVYAESLLNGTPIMYSKDCMGFDGVFENVGPVVDPYSVFSIMEGIEDLIKNHETYRKNVHELRSNGEFRIFSSEYIRSKYQEIIHSLLDVKIPVS